jgi:hypothetical protein
MKTKTKIIKALIESEDPLTIKDISRKINADYRITHTAAKKLIAENIVIPQEIGTSIVCTLTQKQCCDQIFKAEHERRQDVLQDRNSKQLHKDITEKLNTSLYILLIQPVRRRDINLIFISNEPHFKKKVEHITSLIPLPTNVTVFTEEEYKKSKQFFERHIILHGIESYYNLKSNP